jgi:hypothetical protein
VANLNFQSLRTRIEFPLEHEEAQRQTLERLYERKATLEALIESLEEYARCRASAQVTTFPLRGF